MIIVQAAAVDPNYELWATLISNGTGMGFVVWITLHLIRKIFPDIITKFTEVLTAQRTDFIQTNEVIRNDFKELNADLRREFREELAKERELHATDLNKERELHAARNQAFMEQLSKMVGSHE